MKEMMIKQIWELTTEVKGDVIAHCWLYNMEEPGQFQGTDNTGPEVTESQRIDGEEGKDDDYRESENLRDCVCDQTVRIHPNAIEGNDSGNQRKITETIPDKESEHSNRRKRRPPTRNGDFLWALNQISLF
jgi:ribosomal protein S18